MRSLSVIGVLIVALAFPSYAQAIDGTYKYRCSCGAGCGCAAKRTAGAQPCPCRPSGSIKYFVPAKVQKAVVNLEARITPQPPAPVVYREKTTPAVVVTPPVVTSVKMNLRRRARPGRVELQVKQPAIISQPAQVEYYREVQPARPQARLEYTPPPSKSSVALLTSPAKMKVNFSGGGCAGGGCASGGRLLGRFRRG